MMKIMVRGLALAAVALMTLAGCSGDKEPEASRDATPVEVPEAVAYDSLLSLGVAVEEVAGNDCVGWFPAPAYSPGGPGVQTSMCGDYSLRWYSDPGLIEVDQAWWDEIEGSAPSLVGPNWVVMAPTGYEALALYTEIGGVLSNVS